VSKSVAISAIYAKDFSPGERIDDRRQENLKKASMTLAFKASGGTVGRPLAANVDVCGTWKSIRGTVDDIINGLNAIGTLFPIAKKAADVLNTLKHLLDALCP
jgi:hypothetical protein